MKSSSKSVLWRYIIASDAGLAPHISNGLCTLAVCKPKIREFAKKGEWVMAIKSGTATTDRPMISYIMRITEEPMLFEAYCKEYFLTRRDAFYDFRPKGGGKWVDNGLGDHAPDKSPDSERKDKGGKHALLSREYIHFGEQGRSLESVISISPCELKEFVIATQGQKKYCSHHAFEAFDAWIAAWRASDSYQAKAPPPPQHSVFLNGLRRNCC